MIGSRLQCRRINSILYPNRIYCKTEDPDSSPALSWLFCCCRSQNNGTTYFFDFLHFLFLCNLIFKCPSKQHVFQSFFFSHSLSLSLYLSIVPYTSISCCWYKAPPLFHCSFVAAVYTGKVATAFSQTLVIPNCAPLFYTQYTVHSFIYSILLHLLNIQHSPALIIDIQ